MAARRAILKKSYGSCIFTRLLRVLHYYRIMQEAVTNFVISHCNSLAANLPGRDIAAIARLIVEVGPDDVNGERDSLRPFSVTLNQDWSYFIASST